MTTLVRLIIKPKNVETVSVIRNYMYAMNLPGEPRLLKLAENEKELLDVEQPEK